MQKNIFIKKIYHILVFCFFFSSSWAQDIHFSQFYNSPTTLNPAFTGSFNGMWRANANIRNQWSVLPKPFNTSAFSFEKPLRVSGYQTGFGIGYVHDEAGALLLTSDKIFLAASIERLFFTDHRFRFGLQIGITHKSIDPGKITLPEQYSNYIGDFDNTLPTLESNMDDKITFLDLNIGASWTKKLDFGTPLVGLAVYHINSPKESFLDQNSRLHPRVVLSGIFTRRINDRFDIVPHSLIMFHKKATYFNFGSEIYYNLVINESTKKQLFAGIFLRNNFEKSSDALIFELGIVYDKIKFGFSYDTNISDLDVVTNHHGAIEFSLLYTLNYDKYHNYTVPCNRL